MSSNSVINLNALLLSKFDEWSAWLTRRLSLNGTTSDTHDYSRLSIGHTETTSLSTPMYLLALLNMYEQTGNSFYMSKLRAFSDGIINNSMNYRTVTGIGEIFFPVAYYYGGWDRDTGSIYPAIVGFLMTKLYVLTNEVTYKTVADRIATESYDKLAVVKNATDIAWSWAYYRYRDEANAKIGVNRQTFFAWFYAYYGEHVNATFSTFPQRIINWVWRAQLDDGGLAYDIGSTKVNPPYTAFSVWAAISAHLIDWSIYSSELNERIARTMNYLNTDYSASYEYMRLYFLVPVLLVASKDTYFANYVTASKVKSMLYTALTSMHFTEKGFISGLDGYTFGFRWHQLTVGGLFTHYPLSDPTFDIAQYNGFTTYEYASGKYRFNGWTGGLWGDEVRDGKDGYGVRLFIAGRTLHWMPVGYSPAPETTTITNNTFYVRVVSDYATSADITVHIYPSGVLIGDVFGTNTPNIVLENSTLWKLTVANGTTYTIKALTSGNNYYFGTKFLLWFNASNVQGRRLIFVKSPTPSWKYTLTDSQMRLNFSAPQTNYRIIYFPTFSLGTVIPRISDAFAAMESIVDAHNTTQPVTYLIMFNSYHGQISSREPEASWRVVYEETQTSEVKLVGHNLPEEVAITAWRYATSQLTATISAPSGTTSIAKVFVGDKGEPTAVFALNGTLFWSYNSSTRMLELRVAHLGPAEIMVDWRMSGDVDDDGTVNMLDLGEISAHWYPGPPVGPLGYDLTADINYDGVVDMLDVGIVSAYWTGPPKGPLAP